MQYNGKFINPYEILALPHASDFELVKATYRSLVKIYHPDVFNGDKDFAKERLAQLNAAYEFLSDPEQKCEFDRNEQSENQDERQQDFDPDQNSDEFDEYASVIFDQAILSEGGQLEDPVSFIKKINRLLIK